MSFGRVLGVNLKVHYLFLLWLLVSATMGDMVYTVILVISVCIHELGHILTAINLGIGVREVELMPFGGVARLERWLGAEPSTEASIALAGPANSLVLMILGLVYHKTPWGGALLEANILLLAVNLLPVMPLDGGRVLRSIIIRRQGLGAGIKRMLKSSDRIAWAFLGIISLLALWGFFSTNAVVLGAFVLYSASQEKKMIPYLVMNYVGGAEGELQSARVLPGRVVVVLPETYIKSALEFLLPGYYHLFHVVYPDGLVEVVPEEKLYGVLMIHGPGLTFSDALDDGRV